MGNPPVLKEKAGAVGSNDVENLQVRPHRTLSMDHINLGSQFLCNSALCPAEILPDQKEGLPRSLSWRAWSQLQGLAQTLG